MSIPNAKTGTAENTDRQLPLRSGSPVATSTPITKIATMMTRHNVSVLVLALACIGSLMSAFASRSFRLGYRRGSCDESHL